jgi:hypothetical protein
LGDWGCGVTTKIKVGDWVEYEGIRRFVYATEGIAIVHFVSRLGDTDYDVEPSVTPLPDCTGWDWQPEPKYRPFEDAWEFLDAIRGRKVLLNGKATEVNLVDFREGYTTAYLTGLGWERLVFVLDNCTFADTGEPCGVRE